MADYAALEAIRQQLYSIRGCLAKLYHQGELPSTQNLAFDEWVRPIDDGLKEAWKVNSSLAMDMERSVLREVDTVIAEIGRQYRSVETLPQFGSPKLYNMARLCLCTPASAIAVLDMIADAFRPHLHGGAMLPRGQMVPADEWMRTLQGMLNKDWPSKDAIWRAKAVSDAERILDRVLAMPPRDRVVSELLYPYSVSGLKVAAQQSLCHGHHHPLGMRQAAIYGF